MIELERWIYSRNIAQWLRTRPALNLEEQIYCVLSAPHRDLEEKLEGLRELRREAGSQKFLEDRIEAGETLLEIISEPGDLRRLYEADIFCHGRKEEFLERRIFALPGVGIDFIRKQIGEAAGRYEIDRESFFGALHVYYKRGPRHLELEWSIILNSEGKILYCLPEKAMNIQRPDYQIAPPDYSYMKLPYPTGTIVKTADSPFFQTVVGIVVNRKEPWEAEFTEDDEQWLLYPDFLHGGNRTGIGVTKLDDYASITFGADFLLPFRQFVWRYEGEMGENETWLVDLAELVRKDKRYFGMIWRDMMPKNTPGLYEKCRDYVEELLKGGRKQQTADSRRIIERNEKANENGQNVR